MAPHAIVLGLFLLLSGSVYAADRAAELQALKARIQQIETAIQADNEKLAGYNRELEQLDRTLARQHKKIHQLSTEQDSLKARSAKLASQRQQQRRQHQLALSRLGRQLQLLHQLPSHQGMRRWLDNRGSTSRSRQQWHGKLITDHLHDRQSEARQRLEALLQTERNISRLHKQMQHNLQDLKQEQDLLARQKASRQQALRTLNASLAEQGQQLASAKSNAESLERLLRGLAEERRTVVLPKQRTGTSFRSARGKLSWPVTYHLTKKFGSRRSGGLRWDGVLLKARNGAPVKAIFSGTVVYADWLKGVGMLIVLDHGNGYMSLYGRNQMLLKEIGDPVEEGEVIAHAGNSGGQLNPGVYFGIRHDGRPVNPARWCRR